MLKSKWMIAVIVLVLGVCFISAIQNKKDMADASHITTKQIDLINK